MGKTYSEMTPEEKDKHKLATERYRKKHMELYADAARRQRIRDPEKVASYSKKWRDANKESVLLAQKLKKRQRKLEAIEYLGGACSECLQSFPAAVYEFHHLDPLTKDRDPSKMMLMSRERLFNELDKCVLLCANCHRMVHHKEDVDGT